MAKIPLSAGFTLIPEGEHVFKIVDVTYKEQFGKLEIKMETKDKLKHTERYNLLWLCTHVLSDGMQVGVSSIISDMQARNLDAYAYMKASERKYTASYWAGQYQLSK